MNIFEYVKNAVSTLVTAVYNKIVDEPAVTFALVVAAINTASDQSLKGYVVAVALALFRFAVSPALPRIES